MSSEHRSGDWARADGRQPPLRSAGSDTEGHDLVQFGAARKLRLRLPNWGWVHWLGLRRQALGSLLAGRPAVRRLAGAATLVVIAAVGAVITTRGHPQYRGSAGGSAATAHQWFASRRAIAMTRVHHRLLGVRSDWELLAPGTGWEPGADGRAALVRIRFADGRITRTAFPPLLSENLSAFVAGPRGAIIRPYDLVTGYLVPDGRPGRPLPPALERGGPAFPGPLPGQAWATGPAGRLTPARFRDE